MKQWTICTAMLTVSVLPCLAHGQTLDHFGGRLDIGCTQKARGFHAEKIGNRWWLCTPEEHGLFLQGIGSWVYPGSRNYSFPPELLKSKYGGSADKSALATQEEFLSWNFNAVGEKTYGLMEPIGRCGGCQQLPMIQTFEINARALFNGERYASSSVRPTKNIVWGTNSSSYIYYYKPLIDVFDVVNFRGYLAAFFAKDSGFKSYMSSPYFVGMAPGDSDYLIGFGAGPDFDAAGYGGNHNDTDLGRVVLVTSPMQTFDHSATQGNFSGDTEL